MNDQQTPVQPPPPQSGVNPFGVTRSDVGLPRAPTGVEVARNPGKYAGTSFDPLRALPTVLAVQRFSEIYAEGKYFQTLGQWFALDPEGAQRWAASCWGEPLNLDNLSPEQRRAMGMG